MTRTAFTSRPKGPALPKSFENETNKRKFRDSVNTCNYRPSDNAHFVCFTIYSHYSAYCLRCCLKLNWLPCMLRDYSDERPFFTLAQNCIVYRVWDSLPCENYWKGPSLLMYITIYKWYIITNVTCVSRTHNIFDDWSFVLLWLAHFNGTAFAKYYENIIRAHKSDTECLNADRKRFYLTIDCGVRWLFYAP